MEIEIHTYDKELDFELFGKSPPHTDDEIQISETIRLRYKGKREFKAFGYADIIKIVLFISSQMAINLASNWLYDRLKGKRIKKLVIERTEVKIEQGEILRIINEKWKLENDR